MLTPIKKTKVYEHVIDRIKEMVSNGTLKIGDKLPAERTLSKKLCISRTSIREAIRIMELTGLVERKPGRGAFVKEGSEKYSDIQ